MADQPIEIDPLMVELSTERTDRGTQPPPPGPPGPFLPPQWSGNPPPSSGPPTVPPPPPPADGPGGGIATTAPPASVTYVTNHYYPLAPSAPAEQGRFRIGRLHPAWNGSALVAGLFLVPGTSTVLNTVFGDEYGVMMAALALTGLLELRHRGRSWLVRALTCNLLASSVVTGAGLHMYGYIVTGV
ncbi:hypothetical protein [Streptomyces angustmyceticus]|uniref:hypothetical protein n=1 Tax=Streptomyces angustmyceticus TaxID=285578 RepID=UPI003D927799